MLQSSVCSRPRMQQKLFHLAPAKPSCGGASTRRSKRQTTTVGGYFFSSP